MDSSIWEKESIKAQSLQLSRRDMLGRRGIRARERGNLRRQIGAILQQFVLILATDAEAEIKCADCGDAEKAERWKESEKGVEGIISEAFRLPTFPVSKNKKTNHSSA